MTLSAAGLVGLLVAAALLVGTWPAARRTPGSRAVPPRSPVGRDLVAVLLAAAAVATLLSGPAVGVAGVGLGVLAVTRVLHRRVRAERGTRLASARMRTTCDLLAAELRAGAPPATALERVAVDSPDLRPVVAAHRVSADVPRALRRLSRAGGAPGWARLAAAWQVSADSGAGLADVVARIADGERALAARRRLVDAELASARATARLMAVLPVVLLGLGSAGGGGAVTFLLGSWPGVVCLAVGCTLALGGLLWLESIAAGAGRG